MKLILFVEKGFEPTFAWFRSHRYIENINDQHCQINIVISYDSRYNRIHRAKRLAITESHVMSTQNQTFGFTSFAETLGGRLAMVGFSLAVITEVLTGQGIVGQIAALLSF